MRPFIPAPNCVRASLVFSYNESVAMNVLHFRYAQPFDVAHMTQLAEALKDWWAEHLRGWFTAANSLDRIEVQALDADNSPGVTYTTGLPLIGTAVGGFQMPSNVTCAITLRTAYRGRSYRGRIYHVGLLESSVTGNRLAGGAAIALQTPYNQLQTGIAQSDAYDLVVVSYMHNLAWRTTAAVNTVISVNINDTLDSQRRRLTGRGV